MTTFKRGDQFKYQDGTIWILANVAKQEMALICLADGNRWVEPVIVEDVEDIKKREWDQITGTLGTSSWEKIEVRPAIDTKGISRGEATLLLRQLKAVRAVLAAREYSDIDERTDGLYYDIVWAAEEKLHRVREKLKK